MKLWKIFSYEFAYLSRQISTWLYMVVLFAFTFVMNLLTTPGDGVYPNNTFHITAIAVIGGLIWLVMSATIAGEAAARDLHTRMHPLTYSTPVTKLDYLGGRFLAALAVNALLVLALPLGTLLSFHLPGMGQEELLPFKITPYLNVYFLIALPNVIVATALQFTFAALGRQVMTSYIASLLLAIFPQIIAMSAAKLLGNWDLVKLLDPVGVAGIVTGELGTWTPSEKNTRLLVLEGMFLWNRILWLSMAAGLLLLTYLRFSFGNPVAKGWLNRLKNTSVKSTSNDANAGNNNIELVYDQPATATAANRVQRSFGFKTGFLQTLTIAWVSFKKIIRHPVGLSLDGTFALASAIFADNIMTQFGMQIIPTTQQVLDYLTAPASNLNVPLVIIPLLIMYFVGELIWHERDNGVSDIIDSAPVTEWTNLTGKFLGMSLVIIVWMTLLMTGGMLMQLSLDYHELELSLYLKTLFGIQLVDYLLFAMLSLVIHAVVNQKYIGYLVVLLAFSFIAFPSTYQVEHNMLIFGADPGWMYTDMRGFGNTLWPWLWFKFYWIAWTLILAVIARLLWARGREQGLADRLKLARRRFTRQTTLVLITSATLLLGFGSFIYYNTNVLNEYLNNFEVLERKAEYERLYGLYRNTPQPRLAATKLHVDIYPDQQQVDIHAAYTLVNYDTVPIDTIHLGSVSGIEPEEVKFDRHATGVVIDNKHGHYIYQLQRPLSPGDSLQLNFTVHYKQRGFQHRGTDPLVVENGTNFTNFDILPNIGYLRYKEINDAVNRKKHDLAVRPSIPSLYDIDARQKPFSTDQNTFEAIISTSNGEVAVAPGALQQTWTKGDRRYFHYKTDIHIGAEYTILSAKYAVRQDKWNHVAISMYYHPKHSQNIDRMLRSVKTSLEYYTEQFGSYPSRNITIVERAGPGSGGTSDASIIYYGEQYPLMNPDDSPAGFDLPYYIMAHEVAHQWWGLARLTPAHVEGAGVLIEGLAVYSGMQVLEQNYGDGHLRKYLDLLHSSYGMPRSLATANLLQADEDFLYYRKGGLAMYVMSKYIGKEKLNGALRQLLQKREKGEIKLPTTLDLYRELKAVTPDSLNYLLNDLFKENTYWRLKTEQLSAEQTKNGSWQVILDVFAQKVVVDKKGKEKEVPMNDLLEIGIYEEGKELNHPLYLELHRIKSGKQTIKVTVPRKPVLAGIDPNHLMIDIRTDDNVMELSK